MKACTTCKEVKDLKFFNKLKTSDDGRSYRCRVCANASTKKWQEANKLRTTDTAKNWKERNPEKCKIANKSWTLKKQFNLSLDDYAEMLVKQNNKCQICKRDQSEMSRAFAVDHCHSTGKIRGLLCSTCNSYLGYIKDKAECGINLAEYLRAHESSISSN